MWGPHSFPVNSFKLFKIFYIALHSQEVNYYLKTFSLYVTQWEDFGGGGEWFNF